MNLGKEEQVKTDDVMANLNTLISENSANTIQREKTVLDPHILKQKPVSTHPQNFRFSDLLYVLRMPFDYRKTLISAAGFFVGFVLNAIFLGLASMSQSAAAHKLGSIIGLTLFFASFFAGMGITTFLTQRELETGKRLSFREGWVWLRSNLSIVLGFPMGLVASLALVASGIGLLVLIARIPYAGPLLAGLTFGATVVLGMLIVLLSLMTFCWIYSYIPVCEGHSVWSLSKEMWQMFRNNPYRYLLNLAFSSLMVGLLLYAMSLLYTGAFALIARVDGGIGGGELGSMLVSEPVANLLSLTHPLLSLSSSLTTQTQQGWHFSAANWLAALHVLALISLSVGFVWTYFCAAGVVNYHLVNQNGKRNS